MAPNQCSGTINTNDHHHHHHDDLVCRDEETALLPCSSSSFKTAQHTLFSFDNNMKDECSSLVWVNGNGQQGDDEDSSLLLDQKNSLCSSSAMMLGCYKQENDQATIVAGSILIYWIFVSLIPIYNKFFFDISQYPYPIATAGIQLGTVSLLLAVWSVLRPLLLFLWWFGDAARPRRMQQQQQQQSWLLGPGALYKVMWTAPVGILFGLKYGITNLGLALLPAPTHLLLQSTDLIWTSLFAWFIHKDERCKGVTEYLCIVGCVVGSAITSWTTTRTTMSVSNDYDDSGADITRSYKHNYSWWAVFVNLLSPILLGLCIATLRTACKRLMVPGNPHLGGTTMNSLELTCWKLMLSSTVALGLACIMEDGTQRHNHASNVHWYTAFRNISSETRHHVLLGSLLILVFQVNCTALTHLTSAHVVGLVGQLKIIPQWTTAAWIVPLPGFSLHYGNIVGAVIAMVSAAVFAVSKYYHRRTGNQ